MKKRDRYGSWAVVTGASAGLGEEFARQLAAEGFNLFLVARREDRLAAIQQQLHAQHGIEVRFLAADLSSEGADAAVDDATQDLDVGLFINNAGFGYMGRFVRQDPSRLASMVRLNCMAVMLLSHRFANRLLKRGGGGMIIVASLAGFQATPYMALYGATKGFDLLLGEGLSYELRGTGVDVLTLCPGATRTEFGRVSGSTGKGSRMLPPPVVKAALRALGRRQVIVTGFSNKVVAFIDRLFTRRFVTASSAMALRGMVPPEER